MMPCSLESGPHDNWSTLGADDEDFTSEAEVEDTTDPFRFHVRAAQMKEDAMQVRCAPVWGLSHVVQLNRLIKGCESMPSFVKQMEQVHIAALHRQAKKYDFRVSKERNMQTHLTARSAVEIRVFASWAILIALACRRWHAQMEEDHATEVPRKWGRVAVRMMHRSESDARRTCKKFQ